MTFEEGKEKILENYYKRMEQKKVIYTVEDSINFCQNLRIYRILSEIGQLEDAAMTMVLSLKLVIVT